MPQKQLVTQVELASKAKVSKQTISKLVRPKGRLHPALVNGKVDAGHPEVKAYLERRGVDPTFPRPKQHKQTKVEGLSDDGSPESAAALGKMTLEEIGRRFGGQAEFSEVLKELKLIEDIREKRLKNEETEGSLISRDLVSTHIFGAIEEGNQRLLSDVPKALTVTLYANAASNIPMERSETEARGVIGKILQKVRDKVERKLK